jgi:transposase, IS30 family
VSHKTIYKYIYNISDLEEKEKYAKALHRKRRKHGNSSKNKSGPISNPISIHERPEEVESRDIPGH